MHLHITQPDTGIHKTLMQLHIYSSPTQVYSLNAASYHAARHRYTPYTQLLLSPLDTGIHPIYAAPYTAARHRYTPYMQLHIPPPDTGTHLIRSSIYRRPTHVYTLYAAQYTAARHMYTSICSSICRRPTQYTPYMQLHIPQPVTGILSQPSTFFSAG